MFNFEALNKSRFTINTEGFEYRSLKDLYAEDPDRTYTIRGIYINEASKFGPAPLFATDAFYVNLPSHLLDTCKEMRSSHDACESINAGKAGFKIYPYESNGNTFYSVTFVNL